MVRGAASLGDVFSTRALSKFVGALRGRESLVVVDLGTAVGVNVTFLGEALGCKLHVDDILSNNETWWPFPEPQDVDEAPAGEIDVAAQIDALKGARHLGHASLSVDGVLCWDIFDYLDDEAAATLAAEITRILKPGGLAFLCHGPEKRVVDAVVQYEIVDEATLRYRTLNVERPQRTVRESRAITKLFADLTISNSFLLTSRMREVVLRKPPGTVRAD